jgi:hypothetical protein
VNGTSQYSSGCWQWLAAPDQHAVTRRQLACGLVDGARFRHIAVAEIIFHRFVVDVAPETGPGGQGFQFRTENQKAVIGDRVMQRFDAQAVARHEKNLLLAVPQGKGKHAAEVVHAIDAPLFPGMHDGFGIGAGAEGMAESGQFRDQIDEVVDLAVEHHPDAVILVRQGLLTGGDVDDRQATVTEDRGRVPYAGRLRPGRDAIGCR